MPDHLSRLLAASLSLLMAWPSLLMVSAVLWLTPAAFNPAWAAPQDGRVTSGQGVISQDGKTTTIVQSTNRLSINWQSFGIAADETVQFKQPSASAIALNRVIGNDPSQIFGRLNANGRVYLINPNGILFGAGAQVNVGGLVASTLDVDDDSLGSNKRRFVGSSKASVVVEKDASIIADGGGAGPGGAGGAGGEVALLGAIRREVIELPAAGKLGHEFPRAHAHGARVAHGGLVGRAAGHEGGGVQREREHAVAHRMQPGGEAAHVFQRHPFRREADALQQAGARQQAGQAQCELHHQPRVHPGQQHAQCSCDGPFHVSSPIERTLTQRCVPFIATPATG
jgi:filamentous hemagglutinin family protein